MALFVSEIFWLQVWRKRRHVFHLYTQSLLWTYKLWKKVWAKFPHLRPRYVSLSPSHTHSFTNTGPLCLDYLAGQLLFRFQMSLLQSPSTVTLQPQFYQAIPWRGLVLTCRRWAAASPPQFPQGKNCRGHFSFTSIYRTYIVPHIH